MITKEDIVQYFADLHAKYFRPNEDTADCKNCPFMQECNRIDCSPDLPCEVFGHIMGRDEEPLEKVFEKN